MTFVPLEGERRKMRRGLAQEPHFPAEPFDAFGVSRRQATGRNVKLFCGNAGLELERRATEANEAGINYAQDLLLKHLEANALIGGMLVDDVEHLAVLGDYDKLKIEG